MATEDLPVRVDALTDRDLMDRVAVRDPEASEELHRRFAHAVQGFVRKRVLPGEFDDIVQEILYRILNSACSYSGRSSVRAWVYGVARRTIWSCYRDRDEVREWESMMDAGCGPESGALFTERRRSLVAALEGMPEDHAIVLELYRVEGLSHEEIAELLEISPSASRKRLQRASSFLDSQVGSISARKPRHSRLESWRRSLLRRWVPCEPVDVDAH